MLLEDQEVALPGGLARRDDAMGVDLDAGPAAEGDLGDVVLEVRGVDRHAEAGRQGLAVELGVGRPGRRGGRSTNGAVGPVLVGAEVAGEAGQRDGVAERAPALDVEADPVAVAGLEGLARARRIALPSAGPTTSAA